MKFDLKADTDLATYAIFDPAAVLHILNDATLKQIDEEVVAQDVKQGNLLLYSCGEDGSTRFRIYVEEQPDEEVLGLAAGRKDSLLLKVPSGTLCAAGIEYLWRMGKPSITPEEFAKAADRRSEGISIPPGNYLATGFGRNDLWGRMSLAQGMACSGCLLTGLGTGIVILIPLLGTLLGRDWRSAWLYWAAILAIYWVPVLAALAISEMQPSARELRRRLAEREKRFPFDAVIVLRRLPDDADLSGLQGGAFSGGYEPPSITGAAGALPSPSPSG